MAIRPIFPEHFPNSHQLVADMSQNLKCPNSKSLWILWLDRLSLSVDSSDQWPCSSAYINLRAIDGPALHHETHSETWHLLHTRYTNITHVPHNPIIQYIISVCATYSPHICGERYVQAECNYFYASTCTHVSVCTACSMLSPFVYLHVHPQMGRIRVDGNIRSFIPHAPALFATSLSLFTSSSQVSAPWSCTSRCHR